MNKKHQHNKTQKAATQAATPAPAPAPKPKHEVIKLGLDVHKDSIRVVRMIDNSRPQPAQKFTPDQFIGWVARQKEEAREVYSCYEAGQLGYGLHRQLEALGVKNVVVSPCDLDERRKRVNNDATDALALASRLDRFVAGNQHALAVVRVPTEEEEQRRHGPRTRQRLVDTRRSLGAQGRSLALLHAERLSNQWWTPPSWNGLCERLPQFLIDLLGTLRAVLLELDRQIDRLEAQMAQRRRQRRAERGEKKQAQRPKGLGVVSLELIEAEVCDWRRFNNRRQVGSYTGLCPGLSASGEQSVVLSITKQGNRRLATALVELAWRWLLWQPQSQLARKWAPVLCHPKSTARRRKRAIVALARQLAIALWRWQTGQRSPQEMGWVMVAE
ncbi:MAG TPA: IS110 family transposase [Verrucomicrobiae bacterium]